MLKPKLVENKIKFIKQDIDKLSKFKDYTFDQIAQDETAHLATERLIERIVNDAIDINQHIIAENSLIDKLSDYKSSFLLLIGLKILPKKFAQDVADSVGLRNILVHHYRELDEKIFYKSIKDCLKDYSKYCQYILKYIDNL